MEPIDKLHDLAVEKQWRIIVATGTTEYTPCQLTIDIINDSCFMNDIISSTEPYVMIDAERICNMYYLDGNVIVAACGVYKNKEWGMIFYDPSN